MYLLLRINRRFFLICSADEMLTKFVFNLELLFVKSVDRDQPPEDVFVTKDILESVKVSLLLKFYQVIVFELCRELKLDSEIVPALLQVVDIAPVLLNQVQLVYEKTEAECSNHN